MRIANQYLEEIIENHGTLRDGRPVSTMGVNRLALDLREAREQIRILKQENVDLFYQVSQPVGKIVDYRA